MLTGNYFRKLVSVSLLALSLSVWTEVAEIKKKKKQCKVHLSLNCNNKKHTCVSAVIIMLLAFFRTHQGSEIDNRQDIGQRSN